MTDANTRDRWSDLEEKAKAATPGEWETHPEAFSTRTFVIPTHHAPDDPAIGSILSRQDAAFIAAANPATVLSLISHARAVEAESARLRGALEIKPGTGDLWWNPDNSEAGFNHFADAFEDANEDGEDYSVELHRGRLLPPVWGALVPHGDGGDEKVIRLFATEAEADEARAALTKPRAGGGDGQAILERA